jgi:hypothetical protein
MKSDMTSNFVSPDSDIVSVLVHSEMNAENFIRAASFFVVTDKDETPNFAMDNEITPVLDPTSTNWS